MIKDRDTIKPAANSAAELLKDADKYLPGVIDLIKAYGSYEETVLLFQQCLEIGKDQPQITTSNQSCPIVIG